MVWKDCLADAVELLVHVAGVYGGKIGWENGGQSADPSVRPKTISGSGRHALPFHLKI